jgi:cytochrome P450
MGRDFRSLQKNDNPVAESFFRLREPSFEKLVFFALNFILPQWLARHLPLRMNKVINDETNFLRALCQEIVSDKRQALNVSKNLVKDLEADILGTMMLGGDFSDEELVDQMLTFLAGGVSFTFNFPCSNRYVIDYIIQLVKSTS